MMNRQIEQENEGGDALLWRGPYIRPATFDDLIYLLHDYVQWRDDSYFCIEFNITLIRRLPTIQSIEFHGVEFLYDETRHIAICTDLAYYTGEQSK